MRAPLLLLLPILLLGALPARATPSPSRASLQRALEAHARSTVQLQAQRRSGLGVIVGAGGQVLTSVELVGLYEAQVGAAGKTQRVPVVMANAGLRVALVRLPGEDHPAASVALLPERASRPWLIGVVEAGGPRARAVAVRAAAAPGPFLRVPLGLAPGSPLFDAQGRLVALVVTRRGARASEALPLSAVKQQLGAKQ